MGVEVQLIGKGQIRPAEKGTRYIAFKAVDLLTKLRLFNKLYPFERDGMEIARYIRWVDDMVDKGPIINDSNIGTVRAEKTSFINRQIELTRLINGTSGSNLGNLNEKERNLLNLPWKAIPKSERVLHWMQILLGAIKEDAEHLGLIPRSEEELRENFVNSLEAVVQIMSLLVNGKEFTKNDGLKQLAYWWTLKDSVNDIGEDIDMGLIRLPLPPEVTSTFNDLDIKEKKKILKTFFNPQNWKKIHDESLRGMSENVSAILRIDELPAYQKLGAIAYILFIVGRNKMKPWKREYSKRANM